MWHGKTFDKVEVIGLDESPILNSIAHSLATGANNWTEKRRRSGHHIQFSVGATKNSVSYLLAFSDIWARYTPAIPLGDS